MIEPASYSHDGGDFLPVPFRVVSCSWPAPAFVENVAVGSDGSVFVTIHSANRIDRYDPKKTGETPAAALHNPGAPDGVGFRPIRLALGDRLHDAHHPWLRLEGQR